MKIFGHNITAGILTGADGKKSFDFQIYNESLGKKVLSVNLGQPVYPGFIYKTAGVEDNFHNVSIGFGFGLVNITLPFVNTDKRYKCGDDEDDYAPVFGGYLYNQKEHGFPNEFWYYTTEAGKYTLKAKTFPWAYEYISKSYLNECLEWTEEKSDDNDITDRYKIKSEFTYVTKYEEKQKTGFTATMCRRDYVRKSPLLRFVTKHIYWIDIEFDKEIGEDVHSWKGGCRSISVPVVENSVVDPAIMFPKYLNTLLKKLQNEHSL